MRWLVRAGFDPAQFLASLQRGATPYPGRIVRRSTLDGRFGNEALAIARVKLRSNAMRHRQRVLIAAVVFFAVWSAATWFFEGRIDTLLRPDAVADRIVYALVVNLLFGIVGGIALLWLWQRQGVLEVADCGFGPGHRTVASVAVGLVLGMAAYYLEGAPSLNPVVVVNAFSQVFVVSAAEVVVCWCIVGGAARLAVLRRSAAFATAVGAAIASVLFGVYHYGHSAPFNTFPMVALLSAVGLATSVFFFVSRDAAGTIVFHNFLGTFGVVQALSAANAIAPLEVMQVPLIGTALLTGAVLAGGYAFLRGSSATPSRAVRPIVSA